MVLVIKLHISILKKLIKTSTHIYSNTGILDTTKKAFVLMVEKNIQLTSSHNSSIIVAFVHYVYQLRMAEKVDKSLRGRQNFILFIPV